MGNQERLLDWHNKEYVRAESKAGWGGGPRIRKGTSCMSATCSGKNALSGVGRNLGIWGKSWKSGWQNKLGLDYKNSYISHWAGIWTLKGSQEPLKHFNIFRYVI